MKRYVLALAVVLSVVLSSPCLAANGYFGIQAGLAAVPDSDTQVSGFIPSETSYDPGLGLGVMLGTKVDSFRLEGELTYRSNDTDTLSDVTGSIPVSGEVTSTTLMFNGYYDIKSASPVAPYLGLGLGISKISADTQSLIGDVDDSDVVAAFQFVAGIGITVNPRVTFDVSYRYLVTQDPSFSTNFGDTIETEYSSHNLMVGMRFGF